MSPVHGETVRAGGGVQAGGPWGLHGVDPGGWLLPLGDGSAGAAGSVPPPRWGPSTCGSGGAPTVPACGGGPICDGGPAGGGGPTGGSGPAIGGGGAHCSGSFAGRGRAASGGVPAARGGRRCRGCPGRRPGCLGCRGILGSGWRSCLWGVPLRGGRLRGAAAVLVRGRDPRPFVPFPLRERDGRLRAVRLLFGGAAGRSLAHGVSVLHGLQESCPGMGGGGLHRLGGRVLVVVAECHLAGACRGSRSVPPVLPGGAARLVRPLDGCLPGGAFEGCRGVGVAGRARILRVACWLHRMDLGATCGAGVAASPGVQDCGIGPLLDYFLMPGRAGVAFGEVALGVARGVTGTWRSPWGTSTGGGGCSRVWSGC